MLLRVGHRVELMSVPTIMSGFLFYSVQWVSFNVPKPVIIDMMLRFLFLAVVPELSYRVFILTLSTQSMIGLRDVHLVVLEEVFVVLTFEAMSTVINLLV